jgi:hypothetical protein
VELTGKVEIVSRFGPPNFGETPQRDERISVAVLVLGAPRSVCADTTGDASNEELTGLDSVQLVRDDALQQYASKRVVVRGRLARSITGRQFFPAVLMVTGIRAR